MRHLPNNYHITLRPATTDDIPFLYTIHRQGFQLYVEQTWDVWDDEQQRANYERKFNPSISHVIQVDRCDIGILVLEKYETHWYVNNIAITPEYQGKGIGGRVLSSVIEKAKAENKPVRLRCLTVNPAQRLYLRLGFQIVEDIGTHLVMQTPS